VPVPEKYAIPSGGFIFVNGIVTAPRFGFKFIEKKGALFCALRRG